MIVRSTAMIVLSLCVGVAACGTGENNDTEATAPERLPAEPGVPPEGLEQACDSYRQAFNEYVSAPEAISDAEYADRLETIADNEALGTQLEALLRAEAEAFRQGALNIDAAPILAVCDPQGPTAERPAEAWEEPNLRASYLEQVKAADPALAEFHDGDLVAGGEMVCMTLQTADSPQPRSLLSSIVFGASNIPEDRAGAIIDVAVDLFCPEHKELVGAR